LCQNPPFAFVPVADERVGKRYTSGDLGEIARGFRREDSKKQHLIKETVSMAQSKAKKKTPARARGSVAKPARKPVAKKAAPAKKPAAKAKPAAKKPAPAAKKKAAPVPKAKPKAAAKPVVKAAAPKAAPAKPAPKPAPAPAAKAAPPKRAVAVSHRPQGAAVAVQPQPRPARVQPPRVSSFTAPLGPSTLTEDDLRRAKDDDYMNDDQLSFFNERLMQMRGEVLARELDVKERLHQREVFADPADRASAEEEHWLDLRLRERESLLLKKIDDALRRIRDKEYGYCEKTGEPIGIARLLARPTATVCVDVKGQDERAESQYRDR
jgi:DnaK suppressor protein